MKKVQTKNKLKGFFGLFAAFAMAIGVGVSLAPREAVRTQAAETITYTFSSKEWKASPANWTSNKDGGNFTANQGVQISTGQSGANAISPISYSNVSSIVVGYATNQSKGVGSIKVYSLPTASGTATQIGSTFSITKPSSGGTTVKNTTNFVPNGTSVAGFIKIEGICTTNSVYINSIAITYETRTLSSIAIGQAPTKLHYYVGESLDKTGLVVNATYSSGLVEAVDNNEITVEPATMALGTTSVVLSYGGKTVTLSGITVEAAPTVTGLTVNNSPVKTTYDAGESFDYTGLEVIANLNNGTSKDVTALATYSPNPLTAGTTEVSISYGGVTESYGPIVVKAVTKKTITITHAMMALGTSTTSEVRNHTFQDVGFTSFARNQSGAIMFDKGSGYIYNTTSLVNITSIKLSYASGGNAEAVQYFNFGNSPISGSKISGTQTINASPKGGENELIPNGAYGFFNLSVSSANHLQLVSLEITASLEIVDLEGISLNKSNITMIKDETTTLGVSFDPVDATNQKVTWNSSDPAKVSVTGTGAEVTLTALAATGETPVTITATSEDGGFEASASVTVNLIHVTSLTLNKSTVALYKGDTEQLVATLLPANASIKTLNWSSSDSSKVSVSNTGLLTAKEATTAPVIITVTSVDGGFEATAAVTVSLIDVASVSLNETTLTLKQGKTRQLTATVLPANAHIKDLTWSSGDPAKVSVSNTGLVSALAITTEPVVITVTTVNGKTATASVTVVEDIIQEGTYTISTDTTEYYDPLDPSALSIVKSDEDLGDLSIFNIDRTRLNSNPNTDKTITIGRNKDEGGKFTIVLGEGLIAASVTFTNLLVDSGKTPTLTINDGVNFKFSGKTSETLHPYSNLLEISTLGSSRIWTSSIIIEAKRVENAAAHYANLFLDGTSAECLLGNVKETTWDDLGYTFLFMDTAVIEQFDGVVANASGNSLEQFVARYTYIGEKYGYDDFMDLGLIQDSINRTGNKVSNDNLMGVTIIIGVIGLTTLAGYAFLRKKKGLC